MPTSENNPIYGYSYFEVEEFLEDDDLDARAGPQQTSNKDNSPHFALVWNQKATVLASTPVAVRDRKTKIDLASLRLVDAIY